MASDLVLRLCQVPEEDGGLPGSDLSPHEPGYDPSVAHIAVNDFTDGLLDILGGYHTVNQIKNFYSMTTAQENAFDALWSEITSVPQLEKRLGRVHRFRSILIKWERLDDLRIVQYGWVDENSPGDPDAIEARLLEIDTGFA